MREEETEQRRRASDREKVSKGKDFLTLADTVGRREQRMIRKTTAAGDESAKPGELEKIMKKKTGARGNAAPVLLSLMVFLFFL